MMCVWTWKWSYHVLTFALQDILNPIRTSCKKYCSKSHSQFCFVKEKKTFHSLYFSATADGDYRRSLISFIWLSEVQQTIIIDFRRWNSRLKILGNTDWTSSFEECVAVMACMLTVILFYEARSRRGIEVYGEEFSYSSTDCSQWMTQFITRCTTGL